jgi:hypothetical protein
MKTSSTTHTRQETTYEFSQDDIIDALQKAGKLPTMPAMTSLKAWVRVPGGGDWSNWDLTLDDHPVQVKVVTEGRT